MGASGTDAFGRHPVSLKGASQISRGEPMHGCWHGCRHHRRGNASVTHRPRTCAHLLRHARARRLRHLHDPRGPPEARLQLHARRSAEQLRVRALGAVCFVRARRATTFRSSWHILALGLALYGAGNIYWTIAIRPLNPEPFPSIADALFLSFYPCAFASLVLMVREHFKRFSLSLWLDGIVGGLAAAAGAAAAILGPALSNTVGSTAAVITTTAYPLLDLVLLLTLVATLSLYHWRPPVGIWMFAIGLLIFVVADGVYVVADRAQHLPARRHQRRAVGDRHDDHGDGAGLAGPAGRPPPVRLVTARGPDGLDPGRARPAGLRPDPPGRGGPRRRHHRRRRWVGSS